MSGSEILFLAHRLPFPPDRGDRIRAHHLLQAVAALAPVHVGCLVDSEADRVGEGALAALATSHCVVTRSKPLPLAGLEALAANKPVSLTAFHHRKLEAWVRQVLAERPIAAIVVFSGQMGQYVPADFAGRVVVDLCDVDSAKFAAYAEAGERPWLNRREARLLAEVEEALGHRATATVLISEAEAQLYASRLRNPTGVNVQVIGNGVDAAFFDPQEVVPLPAIAARPGPHFVFTGQMDYRPNEQAALWVAGAVLPEVRAVHRQAEFHIVGRSPTPLLRRCADEPGVTVWGEVPDVRPFLAAATCVLAPLTVARGVQNKVLEAMAMARPVLLTPEAATGIAAIDGEHWLVEKNEGKAFAQRALDLVENAAGGERLGEAARRFVLANQAWPAMMAPLATLLGFAVEGQRHAA
ncbi:TIGR03087 family PEP-CTERM/XrtA system glycosyltransferase [Alteraurantiacibacter buctensis]|uniref:TIGR03087 family PEP-CTERM/XrtA system glycosyltransferase n=1 Tax=Alteraurantiacibacter buctensis TaxID=1503981 RepID=A0A844Z368_9SPHN|nr:TIGR03087 family PEP-CTERM/XrtA system glycosyltransferase [Alteraurantiacibacter buctensis]MXO72323.1 TIGR03087 family PEP-CTERM/XrtA system glycosyltransferase [Alteraurantiacibacter buctensis]